MRLKITVGVGVIAGVVMIGGVWMFQERLIYFPGGDPGPPPESWEEIEVASTDGIDLAVWARVDDAATDRPVVIVFPGNAGNRAGRIPLGNALADAGYDVVLAEYRGYGGNPGSPNENGLINDALATIAAFRDRLPSNGGIVYFGESLGAAVAIAAAEQSRPDALVLGSPFTSLTDVGQHHYPWLPVSALLRDRYPSLERIEEGALEGIPALVIGGTGDRTVPIEQSRRIATALEASIYEVEGVDHNDTRIRSAPSMVSVVSGFLTEEPGG
jgi:fermentation-respiration switch protein FrsA (DUF1100 family)